MIKLYSDAATKGNPGPTGLGWLIVAGGKQRQQSATLNRADNHHGEFVAATAAFDDLLANYGHDQVVMFYTDSRLLADAIGKGYAKHYQPELDQLLERIDALPTVVTQWVSESQNHGAHSLANQALQRLLKTEH